MTHPPPRHKLRRQRRQVRESDRLDGNGSAPEVCCKGVKGLKEGRTLVEWLWLPQLVSSATHSSGTQAVLLLKAPFEKKKNMTNMTCKRSQNHENKPTPNTHLSQQQLDA